MMKGPPRGSFSAAAGGNPYAQNVGGFQSAMSSNIALAREQLRYNRDWVFAAVRVIAVRLAGQKIMVGRKPRMGHSQPMNTGKAGGSHGSCGGPLWLKSAPEYIVKQVAGQAENIEVLEDHPFLTDIKRPNDVHVSWHLKQLTAASMSLVGAAYWLKEVSVDKATGQPRRKYWPIPRSWIQPNHRNGLFAEWDIRPPNCNSGWTIPADQILQFFYPDPADPASPLSPLMAMSRAVTTDEWIQSSQMQLLRNSIRPKGILKAGRLPGMMGGAAGTRPVFTPEQRRQLINAIKLAYLGWEKQGEFFLVDGMIEDIVPWGPSVAEMDYLSSCKVTEDRIWLGFGVNPITAGKREGGNRAQAYVAEDHLCSLVINPLIELLSETMTMDLGPLYAQPNEDLLFWIEKCSPRDADLDLRKLQMGIQGGCVRRNEVRNYLALTPLSEEEGGEELIPMPAAKGGFGGAGGGGAFGNAAGGVVAGQAGQAGQTAPPVPSTPPAGEEGEKGMGRARPMVAKRIKRIKSTAAGYFTTADAAPQPADSPFVEVPDIRQDTNFRCGSSAAMCCGRYRNVGPTTLDEWSDVLGTTAAESTSPKAIVAYLSSLGLEITARENMTIDDLAAATAAGNPVIVCCQDYVSSQDRSPEAKWEYGHWLTCIGVVGEKSPYRYLVFQDSSVENQELKPGGDVPAEKADTDANIEAPGRILVREKDWLEAWHDEAEEGQIYDHYGIEVGPLAAAE
jgi:phage portal protein BeeE